MNREQVWSALRAAAQSPQHTPEVLNATFPVLVVFLVIVFVCLLCCINFQQRRETRRLQRRLEKFEDQAARVNLFGSIAELREDLRELSAIVKSAIEVTSAEEAEAAEATDAPEATEATDASSESASARLPQARFRKAIDVTELDHQLTQLADLVRRARSRRD